MKFYWLKHPIRTLYWRIRLRGKVRLTIDIDKSLPIDTQMNEAQKRTVTEFLVTEQHKKLNSLVGEE